MGRRIKITLASEGDSRVEHATRVLHPEPSARRHCDFDAEALKTFPLLDPTFPRTVSA